MLILRMTITYTKEDLRSVLGVCVYVIRKGTDYLYVGSTINGLRRVLSPSHRSAAAAIEDCSHLELIPCADYNEARAMQARLIREHKPKLNKPDGVSTRRELWHR